MNISSNEDNVDDILEMITSYKVQVYELLIKIQSLKGEKIPDNEKLLNVALKEGELFIQNSQYHISKKDSEIEVLSQSQDKLKGSL